MPDSFRKQGPQRNGDEIQCPQVRDTCCHLLHRKYRPYLTRGVFTLRTDNQALSWLKRYSMTRGMAARWIQRLDQYKFHVELQKETPKRGLPVKED